MTLNKTEEIPSPECNTVSWLKAELISEFLFLASGDTESTMFNKVERPPLVELYLFIKAKAKRKECKMKMDRKHCQTKFRVGCRGFDGKTNTDCFLFFFRLSVFAC